MFIKDDDYLSSICALPDKGPILNVAVLFYDFVVLKVHFNDQNIFAIIAGRLMFLTKSYNHSMHWYYLPRLSET